MILYDNDDDADPDDDQDDDDDDNDDTVDLYETGEGGAGKFSTAEPWPPVHLSTLGCTTIFVSKFKIFIKKFKNICQTFKQFHRKILSSSPHANTWMHDFFCLKIQNDCPEI